MVLKRLKEEEIKEISRLVGHGNSIDEVSRKMNISKVTVYYYLRKKSRNKKNPIKIDFANQELIGEFMGLFAGDGNFLFQKKSYQYTIRLYFNVKERSFADDLIENVLLKLFARKPWMGRCKNVLILRYYSKEIYKLIKEYLTWDPNSKKTIP